MAVLLYSLRNVPDDEADAIRALLSENDIDFFETSAGNWGISAPGIWLKDPTKYDCAKELLEEFQKSWTKTVRFGRISSNSYAVATSNFKPPFWKF